MQLNSYLINVRAGDPISCVALRAGTTLKAISGVGTSDSAETRVGVTQAHWGCWGCRGCLGHQCVWGWRLQAKRTWKKNNRLIHHQGT